MSKLVSVIIVSYNTSEILKDCLNNLKDAYTPLEVIVVDNNSPDDSADMVGNDFPWVKLIANTNNVGLAVASNQGYKASKGDYLLYLGSDAFPKLGTIKGMVNYMDENKNVGAATAKLVLRSGDLDPDAHRGFPTPWAALTHFSSMNKVFPKSRLFNQYFMGYADLSSPHEIDLCISHFMMIKREAMVALGGWDEDYFVYGEDVDFCYRLKAAGWKVMYLPQWEAVHYKGAGVGIRKETRDITKATKETRLSSRRRTTQAMELFYKKHYYKKYPTFVTGFVLFGIKILSKLRVLIAK